MTAHRSPSPRARQRVASRATCPLIALLCLGFASTAFAIPQSDDDRDALTQAMVLLHRGMVPEAADRLVPLHAAYPDDPEVLDTYAMLRFHQGAYREAEAAMSESLKQARTGSPAAPEGTREHRETMLALITATAETTKGFVTRRDPSGRYEVAIGPGRDEVLVPLAFEALEKADRALLNYLGVRMPGPIRLEIYPSAAALAEVSSLTVEEIETSGTIALCKWNRLMVTSPRALLRGYPWMDTIAHEMVHLVLTRASGDEAPVWLQEGIAKYLERTWRGDAPVAIVEPGVEAILAEAVKGDALIPFERLHPSIARLPSQKEAALAFAQVATFVENFHREAGTEALQRAIMDIASGTDARKALGKAADRSFGELQTQWRKALRTRPAPIDVEATVERKTFRHGASQSDRQSAEEVREDRAKRFVRLGDLFWDRGRHRAATREYEKALALAPNDVIVATRLARAALASGEPAVALSALKDLQDKHQSYAPIHTLLGVALQRAGQDAQARTHLVEALRLNPFDPEPHCGLALIGDDADQRRHAAEACRTLGGTLPPRPVAP